MAVMFGDLRCLIDIPSFVFVFGITFFMLLANFGKDFLKFIPDSILSISSTPQPNERYAEIAKYGNWYAITAGVIGTILNMIFFFQGLDDPCRIGMGMGVSLLCFFYGLMLAELYFAYQYRTYLGGNTYNGNKTLSPKTTMVAAVFIFLSITSFFLLCYLSTPVGPPEQFEALLNVTQP
jgi:flagellar motor component MotA